MTIKKLAVAISVLSMFGLAQPLAYAESQQATGQFETTQLNTPKPAINAPLDTENTLDTQELLFEVITSDTYTEVKEIEEWERKPEPPQEYAPPEKSWLEKLFDFLFGDMFDDVDGASAYDVFTTSIKLILILALLAFIGWVIYRASEYGWGNAFRSLTRPRSRVNEYLESSNVQHWHDLPAHAELGQVVLTLLTENDEKKLAENIEIGASLLYRGVLRWLAKQKLAYIDPATTEGQCLRQLHAVADLDAEDHRLTSLKPYLTEVIQVWMRVAYDDNTLTSTNMTTIHTCLQELASDWVTTLTNSPINSPKVRPKPSEFKTDTGKLAEEGV